MPYKPKKPCKYQGCPNLTNGAYCDEHKQYENHRYNKYQRNPDNAKLYGKNWNNISKAYRQAHPLCELCLSDNRLTAAVLVHHKRKLTDGGTNDYDNLQSLCRACHSRIHAEQGDRFKGKT